MEALTRLRSCNRSTLVEARAMQKMKSKAGGALLQPDEARCEPDVLSAPLLVVVQPGIPLDLA